MKKSHTTIVTIITFLLIGIYIGSQCTLTPNALKFVSCTLAQCVYWLIVYQGHEKAHQKEAEKYHELKNPVITDDHFDCDNWEDFSETEIKKVAWAGIIFDLWHSLPLYLPAILLSKYTIFLALIASFGNAIPVKLPKNSAIDGYWIIHPDKFLECRQTIPKGRA